MSPTSRLFWEGTISQHESQTSGLQSEPHCREYIVYINNWRLGIPRPLLFTFWPVVSIDFSFIPVTSLAYFPPFLKVRSSKREIFLCNTLLLVTMHPLLSLYYERKSLLVLMDCRSLWITKCGEGLNAYNQSVSVRNNSRCSVKYLI